MGVAGPEETLAKSPSLPRPVRYPSSAQPPYSTLTNDRTAMIGSRVAESISFYLLRSLRRVPRLDTRILRPPNDQASPSFLGAHRPILPCAGSSLALSLPTTVEAVSSQRNRFEFLRKLPDTPA